MAKILFINPVVREEDLPRHVPTVVELARMITLLNLKL